MSRRREEREFARALALSTQVPNPPYSSDQPPASVLLSSPSKEGPSTDNQQSSDMSGQRSTEDIVADSEDEEDEIIGGTSLGSEEQVKLSLIGGHTILILQGDVLTRKPESPSDQSSPHKAILPSTSHIPTKDTIGSFTPLPIPAHAPTGTTSTIQTYDESLSSGVDKAINAETPAPVEDLSIRPKPRPKVFRPVPPLKNSITPTTTTGSHIPTTSQLDSTMPNTAVRPPVALVPSSQMEEDIIDPTSLALPPPVSTKKAATYTRKKKRHFSVPSASEDEAVPPGPSKSTPPKSSKLVVTVEVESAPRIRNRPVHFGFEEAKTAVSKTRASRSPQKAGRSPSPDPLDDDVARTSAKDLEAESEKKDTGEVEIVEPTSKRRKDVDSEGEDYAPVEKLKSKLKGKAGPKQKGSRSKKGKGMAVETVVLSEEESEAEMVKDESESEVESTKKSKSRNPTKKTKAPPKGKRQTAAASEFKSAEMIDTDDEKNEEGIVEVVAKAGPSRKSVTPKKLMKGKKAIRKAVQTDEEEEETEEEEEQVQPAKPIAAKERVNTIKSLVKHDSEEEEVEESKKVATASPAKTPAPDTVPKPLRSIPVNASSPAIKPQSPRVVIDKNGNVKAFKTARDDLPQVVAKSGGVKTMGFSRRTQIPSLHRKIKTPPKKLPPVPQKAHKRKKGDDSDEDSDGLDANGNKKIRRGDREWYMQADDGF